MKKNIIVRQHDFKDCGACSLLSIIKYYDGFVPLEKIRKDTQTSMEGTNAYRLVQTAKNYGFDSYGMKFSSYFELKDVVLPAIAHLQINNTNHFVVLLKITAKNVYLMDPAKGKIKIKSKDFLNMWTKNLLLFYPKYQIPNISNKNYLKSIILEVLKKEKKTVLKIIFLTALLTFLTLILSFYFKIGINLLEEIKEITEIKILILFFSILLSLKCFTYFLRNYFRIFLSKNFDSILYYDFIKHLFLLPIHFIKDRTHGEIMIRIKDLENVKDVFLEIMITLFLDSILAFSVGIILYKINKTLFFVLCFFVLIYFIYGIIMGKMLYKKALEANESEIHFHEKMIENMDVYVTLKNLNVVQKCFQKIEYYLFKYLNNIYNFNKNILNTHFYTFSIEELLHFFIITIGFFEIQKNQIVLIDLITFEMFMNTFITPFKSIIQILPNYNYVKVNLIKLNDFYNVTEEETNKGLHEFQKGDICIEKLNFSYNPFSPLFKDFKMCIKENAFVLFKGKSGSGKSSLCKMISRLQEVENNKIKIGKVSINDYSLQTIRENITYVSQKETLLQDTIKNNILFYREITEENWQKVLELCCIEEIVEKKPLRYETFLTKDALNLSGGEKQRLILARALLNPFQILILDESLSELNEELEIKIIKNIKQYFKKKTIIYVSHKNLDQYFDDVYDFGGQK